ncbi:hypothetical protein U2F10_04305 [Leptothoe sp. EHU-05/26/07-4]
MWSERKKQNLMEKMAACEKRLQDLVEDYKILSAQIATESNLRTKKQRKRELEIVNEEMLEVEQEYKRFEVEYLHLNSSIKKFSREPKDSYRKHTGSSPPTPKSTAKQKPPNPPTVSYRGPTDSFSHGDKNFETSKVGKYFIPLSMSFLLIFMWSCFAISGKSLSIEVNNTMIVEELAGKLAQRGLIGGVLSGFFLSLGNFFFKSSLSRKKISYRKHLKGILVYCTVGAFIGYFSWLVAEASVQDPAIRSSYASGAIWGALLCTFFSLFVLWKSFLAKEPFSTGDSGHF